jgi:hypothetical protein
MSHVAEAAVESEPLAAPAYKKQAAAAKPKKQPPYAVVVFNDN